MLAKKVYVLLMFPIILLFSGCNRVIDWGTQRFYQGCKIDPCLTVADEHIRTARVYDQFSALGIFTALWLSDDVLKAYARLHAKKYALDEYAESKLLERQRADIDNKLSFYILAYDLTSGYSPLEPGKHIETPWTIFLKSEDRAYEPSLIKKMNQLAPEYELFFGKHYTNFKTVYLVQFSMTDSDGQELVFDDTQPIILCLNSIKTRISLIWRLDENGNLKVNYDRFVNVVVCMKNARLVKFA